MKKAIGNEDLYERIRKELNKLFGEPMPTEQSEAQQSSGREYNEDTIVKRMFTKSRATLFIGPPCCGKSHFMDKLAMSIVSGNREDVESVSFSSSYCYEDFIQKYDPKSGNILDGPFMRGTTTLETITKKSANNSSRKGNKRYVKTQQK